MTTTTGIIEDLGASIGLLVDDLLRERGLASQPALRNRLADFAVQLAQSILDKGKELL